MKSTVSVFQFHSGHPDHSFLRFCLFVALPIAIGASIYLLFRTTSLLVFQWLIAVGLFDVTISVRGYFSQIQLADWLLYCLPDGIWVYALTNWMILIWEGCPPAPWLLIGLILGVGGEIGQALSIVPGTYQHLDLVFYCLGFGMACLHLKGGT